MTHHILLVSQCTCAWKGLQAILEQEPDIKVTGPIQHVDEALTHIAEDKPDLVVLGCHPLSLEVAREAQQRQLPLRVLGFSTHVDSQDIQTMVSDIGASGFLLCNEEPNMVVQAVHTVAQGGSWYSPEVTTHLLRATAAHSPNVATPETEKLTERELETVCLIAQGKTNKEIARSLAISPSTVAFHIKNVLRKLRAASRVEAAVWAREHGFCP